MIWVSGRMVGEGDFLRSADTCSGRVISIFCLTVLCTWLGGPLRDVPEQNDPGHYPDSSLGTAISLLRFMAVLEHPLPGVIDQIAFAIYLFPHLHP